jgi:oxalate decarboxylase
MNEASNVTRREFVGLSTTALAAAGMLSKAKGQDAESSQANDHNAPNETAPGAKNEPLDKENPSSVWPPDTDSGTVPPFKYSFSLAHKRIERGGWTRQVTARELPISKTIAGVEMDGAHAALTGRSAPAGGSEDAG